MLRTRDALTHQLYRILQRSKKRLISSTRYTPPHSRSTHTHSRTHARTHARTVTHARTHARSATHARAHTRVYTPDGFTPGRPVIACSSSGPHESLVHGTTGNDSDHHDGTAGNDSDGTTGNDSDDTTDNDSGGTTSNDSDGTTGNDSDGSIMVPPILTRMASPVRSHGKRSAASCCVLLRPHDAASQLSRNARALPQPFLVRVISIMMRTGTRRMHRRPRTALRACCRLL